MHDITLSFLNEGKNSIDEENLVLFHRLITGLKFELLENLRFNEFETVKIIKPRL